MRTVPALRDLHRLFAPRGVEIVGVHSPEFDFERSAAAVRDAVARLEIPYAVLLDDDHAVWAAFANRYWPAAYLFDREGRVVWRHVGELHRGTPDWEELVAILDRLAGPPL